MTKTYEQLMDMLREKMLAIDPEFDFREGAVCYDLLSPLAYLMKNFYDTIEQMEKNLDVNQAPMEILKVWAKPRIGEPRDGTYTKVSLQGEDLDHEKWVLKRDNSYSFVREGEEKGIVICEQKGYVELFEDDVVIPPEDLSITARIDKIINFGKEEETIEQYRRRYIQSQLVDAQAGLGTYYENQIAIHPKIGECGIDYGLSINGTVVVCTVNTNYEQMTTEEIAEIQNYFTTEPNNIVPIGQVLQIETATPINISVTLSIKNVKSELTEELVREKLESYRKDTIVPEMLRSRNLTYTIDIIQLRNELIAEYSTYGNIITLKLNDKEEDIQCNKTYPKWTTITIEVLS